MEQKRDFLAALLAVFCWLALLAAEFFYVWGYLPWEFCWSFLLLTVLLLAFSVVRRKLPEKKAFLRIAGLVLAAVTFLTASVCYTDAAEAAKDLWWTDDLSHYERLRGLPVLDGTFRKEDKLNFFPYTIPDYAGDVKFHYHPQIMQGGGVSSLEFTAPPEKVSEWEAVFREKEDYPGSYLDQGIDFEQMNLWLGCSQEFRVYVIYAKSQLDEENPPLDHLHFWNHGHLYLGAVNYETNRVYFYKTNW